MARHSRPRRGRDQSRHRFRSKPGDPKKQAAGIVKRLQGNRIRSVGTARNYQERLVQIAARLDVVLTALTPERAEAYLRHRAAEVGQKTLDMKRQAIQAMMANVTGQTAAGRHAAGREVAEAAPAEAARVLAVAVPRRRRPAGCAQRVRHRDRPRVGDPGPRAAHLGPSGRAAARRPARPVAPDRHRYDIGGGQAFSASFSRASVAALGKTKGAHSLRYSYAQQRMRELMHHAEYRLALAIVSEEMGRLRPEITLAYLV